MDWATCYQPKSNAGRPTRRRTRDLCRLRATPTQTTGSTRIYHYGCNRPTRIFLARQSQRFSLHDTPGDHVEGPPSNARQDGTAGDCAHHSGHSHANCFCTLLLAVSDYAYLIRKCYSTCGSRITTWVISPSAGER